MRLSANCHRSKVSVLKGPNSRAIFLPKRNNLSIKKMLRTIAIVFGFVSTLAGCAAVETFETVESYNPAGRDRFVLNEVLSETLGYDSFCLRPTDIVCRPRLDYYSHVGKEGYFATDRPVPGRMPEVEMWPVVLENKRKYYYKSTRKHGKWGGHFKTLMRYEEHQALVNFRYEPGDREQFAFVTKEQNYFSGDFYNSVCPDFTNGHPTCGVEYQDYVGMRGYFEDEEPRRDRYSETYEYRPIRLENGELMHLEVRVGVKHWTVQNSDLIPLSFIEEVEGFDPGPLVPGSDVTVSSVAIDDGLVMYTFSNGETQRSNWLGRIRELSSRFPKTGVELAELLTKLEFSYDEETRQYKIKRKYEGFRLGTDLNFTVLHRDGRAWGEMDLSYIGPTWIFFDQYGFGTDGEMWMSGEVEPVRVAGSRIIESLSFEVAQSHLDALSDMAISDEAYYFFFSDDVTKEHIRMSDSDKANLGRLLRVYELMQ